MDLSLCADRKLLGFNIWIETDSFTVCWPNVTCFLCADRLTWFSCEWSKWTWFSFLCKGIEIDFILGWGSSWLVRSSGVKLDWFLGVWSNLTSFESTDRNWRVFCAGVRNWLCVGRKWLVSSVVIDWPCFGVGGRNWLGFWMRAANTRSLVLV